MIPAVTFDGLRPLAERYEQLRAAVLNSGGRRAPGLASVRRQGLWAWIELVRAADDASPRRPARISTPRRHASPPVFRAELVQLWVNLVLGQAAPMEAR